GAWSPTTDHAVGGCLTCRTPLTTNAGGVAWCAGPGSDVARLDQSGGWIREATGLKADVLALWGAGDGTVVAVGDGGGIAIRKSGVWTVAASPTHGALRAVWGSGAIVYAAGDLGAIVRFDGTRWTLQASGTASTFRDLWLLPGTGVFAVGDGGVIV